MGTEGIDDVLGCQLDEDDNTKIYAKDLYNPQNQKTYRHNEINDVRTASSCIFNTRILAHYSTMPQALILLCCVNHIM